MSAAKKRLYATFPRSAHYDPQWVREHSMGENVLFNLESLTSELHLKPGMRVLDLGCGKAISSIFLAKEYGVQVWAVDEAISPTENLERVQEAGLADKVFPLQGNARELPFPEEYFDAVIVVDSYTYFGTDEKYLPYICKFIKPSGYLAIADVCFTREITTLQEVPGFLRKDFQNYWYFIHAITWWQQLWEKTGLVEIKTAETLPAADLIRQEYIRDFEDKKFKDPFARALADDKQGLISFFRLIARRTQKNAYLQSYKPKHKS
ncbi:methyltransferase domain-containing protein [Adhaeribacter swui]|uniref:Methyltransferase domain-containing protein n=1 Tax=Adhaeribacter swui TaxID=2086471 RepID=A0A7G7G9N6_9BACT|nr:class I SAM-dependent methyltransferase [Adhaeribacter swui]QNF33870.1 methyltransferase domain-containing protein [Adhaeribacter swui]